MTISAGGRGIDYRLRHEAVAIDPTRQEVTVIDRESNREYREAYDFLVYATGNRPVPLALSGFDYPAVCYFKTLDDTRRVKSLIFEKAPARSLLVGSGYTNLEVADVLYNMKVRPVIVEKAPTILPAFAPEIRDKVLEKIAERGIGFHTGVDVLEKRGNVVRTTAGDYEADLVVVSIGVRPNTSLFAAAGGELGVAGAVKVDRYLRTTLPNVFAGGTAPSISSASLAEMATSLSGRWPISKAALSAATSSTMAP